MQYKVWCAGKKIIQTKSFHAAKKSYLSVKNGMLFCRRLPSKKWILLKVM